MYSVPAYGTSIVNIVNVISLLMCLFGVLVYVYTLECHMSASQRGTHPKGLNK